MQSTGLALTLSLLTGTFVALDLTDVQTGSTNQTISQVSSINNRSNSQAMMPSIVPGFVLPKADIRNGIFALGSSTGKEGLDDDGHDSTDQEADADEATDSPATPTVRAKKANDFVLI